MLYKFKTEKEWLDKRRTVITATEAPSLFGLNPYKSVNQMMKDKINPVDLSGNHFIWAGHIYEPGIVLQVNKMLDQDFDQIGSETNEIEFYVHDKARLGASPDAMNSTGDIILEAKSASEKLFEKWEEGVPPHYEIQVRVQMACMGVKKAYIACIPRNSRFRSTLKDLFEFQMKKPNLEKRWKNILTMAHDLDRIIVKEIKYSKKKEKIIVDEVNRFWKTVEDEEKFVIDQDLKQEILK